MVNDGVCTSVAWVSGVVLTGGAPALGFFAVWAVLVLLALYSANQYSLEPHDERAIRKGVLMAGGGTLTLAWGTAMTALLPAILAATCLALLLLLASRRLWGWMFSCRATRRRTLLLCNGPEAEDALNEIRRHPLSGIRALGLISEKDQANDAPLSLLGEPGQLPILAQAWKADSIVAGPSAVQKSDWRQKLSPNEETLDIPGLFERLSYRIPVRHVDERWFIEQFTWNRGIGYRITKRAVDIAFSLFGLMITAWLLPVMAIANLLDDRGPLFYSQERVGLNGKTFRVHKLRTMRVDAEKHGAVWAQKNDTRVTRFGQFLRLSRLDELPQLWNVLKGDMSLVGPRPERPEFVRDLEQQIPYYQHRHLVPPGVTGWAQVRFPYGSSVQDAEEKLKFDLYYAKHRSILFDLLIMLRTVSVVLNKTGSR
jgi:exopolysaccharide biosynthesis polyprenyl glycosylphosphotransferase